MSKTLKALKNIDGHLAESMGVRKEPTSRFGDPVRVDPKDIGRRPLPEIARVEISQVIADPDQPRTEFSEGGSTRPCRQYSRTWTIVTDSCPMVGPTSEVDYHRRRTSLASNTKGRTQLHQLPLQNRKVFRLRGAGAATHRKLPPRRSLSCRGGPSIPTTCPDERLDWQASCRSPACQSNSGQ